MQLYLVRHAKADPGTPDESRPLSGEGDEQARRLGRRLKEEGVRPDVILSSPLLRARQTADALARATEVETEPDARLAPGATAGDVLQAIAGRGERVVVVGHQPDCGRIAAALRGGEEPSFPAAGMILIDLT